MCVVCGCGGSAEYPATIDAVSLGGGQAAGNHSGGQAAGSLGGGVPSTTIDFSANEARVSVPGMSTARVIRLEEDVLGANNRVAELNRNRFEEHKVLALNLVSSPGSGKTTLLCETLLRLQRESPELGGSGKPVLRRFRSTPAKGAISMHLWWSAPSLRCMRTCRMPITTIRTHSMPITTIRTRRMFIMTPLTPRPTLWGPCSSSKTWAIWSARRFGILAKTPRSSCSR